MKTLFTILFFIFSITCFAQRIDENNQTITMSMESVSSILLLSDNCVKVSNTETMVINFNNRYIEVKPGIHRIKLDIDDISTIVLIPKPSSELSSMSNSWRIVKNGQEDINYLSEQITQVDYIEYTINGFVGQN